MGEIVEAALEARRLRGAQAGAAVQSRADEVERQLRMACTFVDLAGDVALMADDEIGERAVIGG